MQLFIKKYTQQQGENYAKHQEIFFFSHFVFVSYFVVPVFPSLSAKYDIFFCLFEEDDSKMKKCFLSS